MNVGSIQDITPLGVGSILRARSGASKVVVPVRQGEYVYAKFKHIFGFPSLNRGEGYSVSKLRALDNLIDRMKVLGRDTSENVDIKATPPSRIDDLINAYRSELHVVAQTMAPTPAVNAEFSGLSVDVSI